MVWRARDVNQRDFHLPLAIELAAAPARVRLMPPAVILSKLAHRLEPLTGAPPGRPRAIDEQSGMQASSPGPFDPLDRAGAIVPVSRCEIPRVARGESHRPLTDGPLDVDDVNEDS